MNVTMFICQKDHWKIMLKKNHRVQTKKQLNENILFLMGKCIELKRDIEVDKFTKPILKYVAPYFHFDKLKYLEDDPDLNKSKNSNTDQIKLKIVKPKNKN